jgi:glycosyltransferase involved in cell wall biosynthesis
VGFIGTLKPWHGLPTLVEAFAELYREDPTMRLLVVGDGPLGSWLEHGLKASGISHATRTTGAVSPQSIPALLSAMDAAVAPYTARPDFYFSPLKILEYMAAGLPVVASRIGQIQELISDGETGLLSEPDDAHSLADHLRRLRDDPALRYRLGAAARRNVERHHTWLDVTQRIFAHAGVGLPGVRC